MGKLFKTGWARKPRDAEGRIIRRTEGESEKEKEETHDPQGAGAHAEEKKVEVVTVVPAGKANSGVAEEVEVTTTHPV